MKKLILYIILFVSGCNYLSAQITTIWKNGEMLTYVDVPDSIVFEDNVDLNRLPPVFNNVSFHRSEDIFIFSVQFKSIVDLPFSCYGW